MKHRHLLAAVAALAIPSIACAGLTPSTPLPEPETFALLAAGAIALVVARWCRRK